MGQNSEERKKAGKHSVGGRRGEGRKEGREEGRKGIDHWMMRRMRRKKATCRQRKKAVEGGRAEARDRRIQFHSISPRFFKVQWPQTAII